MNPGFSIRGPARALLLLLMAITSNSHADTSKEATWTVAAGGNGHTYRVVAKSGLISWDQAYTEAQAAGGYLATITSAAENAFVFSLIDDATYWKQSANGHGPWIGGYQAAGSAEPDGGWTWVTRTGSSVPEAFSYTSWESGEPNNLTANVGGVIYSQNNAAYFHTGTGHAATWSDEFDQTGANLNQWTFSYLIEFSPTPPVLTNLVYHTNGAFEFTVTNHPGSAFQVYATTNLMLPFNQWTNMGIMPENPAGVFHFIDSDASKAPARFYRVVAP